jgi:glutamine---fructose-6-phosphate transaminase (isomerizing)
MAEGTRVDPPPGGSQMAATMRRQPTDLAGLLADRAPVEPAAARLAGRRVLLVGTGTSLHAAHQGAWLLRAAGLEAWAVPAIDAALHGLGPGPGDALVLLSHTGAKRYAGQVLAAAREGGVPPVHIGTAQGGADLPTVERERSSAYTASHLAALLRLAQLAGALGAGLTRLDALPEAVRDALDGPSPGVAPPPRLLQYTGAGPNAWTAAEGALKVRETARVAADGLGVEQLQHGPAVALDARDALVALDGGGPAAERLAAVADAAERSGVRVHRFAAPSELGELLSIFPLTVVVQRIALECAEALGTDPDAFGYDVPGREAAWQPLGF